MAANAFGSLLDALIRERCRTIAAFVSAVSASGHRIDHTLVSRIINGSDPIRRPPIEQIEAWSAALKLSPKEARSFRIEALLTHTPEEIVEMVRGQRAREIRQEKMNERHRTEAAAMEAHIANLERLIRPA